MKINFVSWGDLPLIISLIVAGVAIVEMWVLYKLLGEQTNVRQFNILRHMHNEWNSERLEESRGVFKKILDEEMTIEDYLDNHSADRYKIMRLPNLFEFIGYLVEEDVIEVSHVDNLLGSTVREVWPVSENYFDSLEYFGILHDKLEKRNED